MAEQQGFGQPHIRLGTGGSRGFGQPIVRRAATTPTPAANYQPSFPIMIAAYFGWYVPTRWDPPGGSEYTPLLGQYTTADPTLISGRTVMQWHIFWAKYAHIQAFGFRWEPATFEHDNMMLMLQEIEQSAEYPNLRVCALYDLELVADPTVEGIVATLQYLESTAFQSPAYLRVDGKPVLFVFSGDSPASGPDTSARWVQGIAAYGQPVYVGLQVYTGWEDDPNQLDTRWQFPSTLYLDAPAASVHSYSASCGFWKVGEAVTLPRSAVEFENAIQAILTQSDIEWVWFTLNEWHEGSQIEPTIEDSSPTLMLDVLRDNLPALG